MSSHKQVIAIALLLCAVMLVSCNSTDSTIQPGAKIGKYVISTEEPGEFLVKQDYCPETGDCTAPAGSNLNIGYGVVGFTPETLATNWDNFSGEMYINGLPVDLAAFGYIDTTHPSGANGVRLWNITVENPVEGKLTVRWVTDINGEHSDETRNITFTIP